MSAREFTSLSRFKPYRDAKSIVIATEGELTEPIYFEALAFDERYRHPRVTIQVLPTKRGCSAPSRVIRRLDEIRREHRLYEGDELWLVLDKDRWKDTQLSEVTQLANQKGYKLADSNPCFELWLLVHHRSLSCYTQSELDELQENRKERFRAKRRRLERELIDICGSYNKRNLNTSDYMPFVSEAIANARSADSRPEDRWLNQIGSRVYKVVESIINSSNSTNNPLD